MTTIIFWGSDDFALVNLQRLLADGFSVRACVTQPDKAAGRGLKIQESPIKVFARSCKIPVLQPANVRDEEFIRQLKEIPCDLYVVVAYGNILPAAVLKTPPRGAVNVHGSLLPKYRGAAPINWAIINGEKETGVSVIQMNLKMDAGDILGQEKIRIEHTDTAVTLRAKMAKLGAKCLVKVIREMEKGDLHPRPQDSSHVTLAIKLTKEHGRINWNKSAQEIHNLVRGLLPWPGAHALFHEKQIKILETAVMAAAVTGSRPGTVVEVRRDGLAVVTGNGTLLLKTVHPESAKPMDGRSFAVGHQISADSYFQF